MDYRKLGNSGAAVTSLCLGTMTFGAESDEPTSFQLLDDYAAAGGNFIDTADVYSNVEGHSSWDATSAMRASVVTTRFWLSRSRRLIGIAAPLYLRRNEVG